IDSASKVEGGTQLVGQSGEALNEISAAVHKVSDVVSEIADASRTQANNLGRINKAVGTLDSMTQQNAALVEEAAAASATICSQAERLAGLVTRYRIGAAAAEARATDYSRRVAAG